MQSTQPSGQLANISFGIAFYNAVSALPTSDLWIDEIAFNSSRIGCAN